MFKVFVENLEFYGYHGVSAEERVVGHRYELSCTITVNGAACSTDNVSDTVDYGALALLLQRIGVQTQYQSLERLAEEMCSEIFAAFKAVQEVSIKVSKIAPPMPVIAQRAGVEMTKMR